MKPMLKNWSVLHKKSDFWAFLKNRESWQPGVTFLARSQPVELGGSSVADPCDRAGNLPTIPRVLNIFRPQKTFTYLASLLQTVFLMSEKGALYIISPHIRLLSQYTLIIPKGWKIYSWLTIAVPLGGVREDRKHWHSRWWDWEPSELLLPSQGQLPGAERPYSWEVLGPFSCIFLCKIFQMLGAVAVKFSSIRKICVNLPQDRYDCL